MKQRKAKKQLQAQDSLSLRRLEQQISSFFQNLSYKKILEDGTVEVWGDTLNANQRASWNVPNDTISAWGGWWAGGGDYFYISKLFGICTEQIR